MTYQTTREEAKAMRSDRERMADLLARYPRLTDDETQEILTFLRTGRQLDIGLLSSNDRVRPKFDQFMEDHKAHLRLKWTEGAGLIAGIAAILSMLWLIGEALA